MGVEMVRLMWDFIPSFLFLLPPFALVTPTLAAAERVGGSCSTGLNTARATLDAVFRRVFNRTRLVGVEAVFIVLSTAIHQS
jgi:hypothetical protein